jgi:hypothetical protein
MLKHFPAWPIGFGSAILIQFNIKDIVESMGIHDTIDLKMELEDSKMRS